MAENKRRLDRMLAPAYLGGVEARPIGDIREMRTEVSEEEALISYERRVLHGRLAILRAELDRRTGKSDVSIVEMLPKVLSDERRTSRGQFPSRDPRLDFTQPQRRVSKLVSDDTLSRLPEMESAEVERIVADLEEAETPISETRRSLLDVLDALNRELARRYRTGEADPSDLLSGR